MELKAEYQHYRVTAKSEGAAFCHDGGDDMGVTILQHKNGSETGLSVVRGRGTKYLFCLFVFKYSLLDRKTRK